MNFYLSSLKKYAVFSGRASRGEYWYFVLLNVIIAIGLAILDTILLGSSNSGSSIFVSLFNLAILVPSFSVSVRRMHDVNKSGWFILIPIYSFILLCTEGTKGDNQYGPDSKTTESK